MSSIYILRHATSLANEDPSIYKTMFNPDIPLSDTGQKEVLKVVEKLSSEINGAVAVFSSHYVRTIQTAQLIAASMKGRNVKQNIFLAERNYGEQEGCDDVDNFENRPLEKYAYEKAGYLAYSPVRGESLLDVQMRVSLFVSQQNSFKFTPSVVIVSHKSTCLMFHSYFTGELPTEDSDWKNCELRKYEVTVDPSKFNYKGKL